MFSSHQLQPGQTHRFHAGHRFFQVSRTTEGWVLARWDSQAAAEELDPADPSRELPGAAERLRQGLRSNGQDLTLRWIGHAHPLIVAVPPGLLLRPNEHHALSVEVPLALQVLVEGDNDTPLYDGYVRTISKTWYGSYTEGVAAWFFEAGAGTLGAPGNDLASLEVRVTNHSEKPLPVRHLLMHPAHAGIYQAPGGALHLADLHMEFESDNRLGDVHFDSAPPAGVPGATLACAPRNPESRVLLGSGIVPKLGLPQLSWAGLGLGSR